MKEIKFRACANGTMYKYAMPTLNGEKVNVSQHENGNWNQFLNRDECELMQYTGLKDKNGVEIYEGDIITSEKYNPSNYLVEFIEAGFCATNPDLKGYPIDINHFYPSIGCVIEVVGNIYENPELLK